MDMKVMKFCIELIRELRCITNRLRIITAANKIMIAMSEREEDPPVEGAEVVEGVIPPC